MTAAPTIERSRGVLVAGFNPGGGRIGIDATLDAMVVEAAERMRTAWNADVEIRFNSDRRSGGAFLTRGASVGTNVARIDLAAFRADRPGWDDRDPDDALRELGVDPAGPPVQYIRRVMVDASRMRDPSLANCTGTRPYLYAGASDLDEAMALIATHFDGRIA